MPFVKMPDGKVVEMPDNPDPKLVAEMALYMSPSSAASAPPAAPQESGSDIFKRRLGILARGVGTGLTGTVGLVGDALNTGINKLAGTQLGRPSAAIQQGMDAAGLPTPQTGDERFMHGAATLGAGMLDPAMGAITQGIKGAKALGGGALYDAPAPVAPKAATIANAQSAGYRVPPSEAGAGPVGRALEAVAGSEATGNLARQRNIAATDSLARRATALPPDAPLTKETLQRAIDATWEEGYKPITQLGHIPAMPQYQRALDDALRNFEGMSRSFPGAAKPEIADRINAYRVHGFDAADALLASRQLREGATQAFKGGDDLMGKTNLAISRALEDNIENYLASNDANLLQKGIVEGEMKGNRLSARPTGRELLQQFRDARVQLAKQYTVRDAVIPGAGSADALKIAAAMRHGKPLTDELRTIGEFANVAPQLASYPKNPQPLLTGLESYGIAGALGAALPSGGASLPFAAAPVGRAALRQGLLTQAGQRMFAQPAQASAGFDPRLLNALPAGFALGSGLFGQ